MTETGHNIIVVEDYEEELIGTVLVVRSMSLDTNASSNSTIKRCTLHYYQRQSHS